MLSLPVSHRCISFDSYIKPQLPLLTQLKTCVVYLLIPTSNHNQRYAYPSKVPVVYLLIPTSNHNPLIFISNVAELYIFWFLHQTTTSRMWQKTTTSCISFDSYIKPQPSLKTLLQKRGCISFDSYIKPQRLLGVFYHVLVVYLLIPTSNHNLHGTLDVFLMLYIFWFLHQTTTEYESWW